MSTALAITLVVCGTIVLCALVIGACFVLVAAAARDAMGDETPAASSSSRRVEIPRRTIR